MALVTGNAQILDQLAVLYDAELTATPPVSTADKEAAVDMLRRLNRDDLADAQVIALGL